MGGIRTLQRGGIVIAQSPDTCKVANRPRSAMKTAAADFVLAPEAIATELLRLVRAPHRLGKRPAG